MLLTTARRLARAGAGGELTFGREVRRPAMQAGLTGRQLKLREILEAGTAFLASKGLLFVLFDSVPTVSVAARRTPLAA